MSQYQSGITNAQPDGGSTGSGFDHLFQEQHYQWKPYKSKKFGKGATQIKVENMERENLV